jgi:hypothetical protein
MSIMRKHGSKVARKFVHKHRLPACHATKLMFMFSFGVDASYGLATYGKNHS